MENTVESGVTIAEDMGSDGAYEREVDPLIKASVVRSARRDVDA